MYISSHSCRSNHPIKTMHVRTHRTIPLSLKSGRKKRTSLFTLLLLLLGITHFDFGLGLAFLLCFFFSFTENGKLLSQARQSRSIGLLQCLGSPTQVPPWNPLRSSRRNFRWILLLLLLLLAAIGNLNVL